jgi:hypothetical protein
MPHHLSRWRNLQSATIALSQHKIGWKNHRHNGSLSVVRDFHRAASKLDSTVCKGGEHHHAIHKLHGPRMRSGKIVDIAANAISKILTRSGQVKVKSRHDHTPLKTRC